MRGSKCLMVMAVLGAVPLAAWGHWDPEQAAKWVQYPDLSPLGIDVNATGYETAPGYILADDFECRQTGPITDIHIWGSWLQDILPMNDPTAVVFTLSIHADIPASQSPTGYSMPGSVLWVRTFQPGQFTARVWRGNILEGWMDPPQTYLFPADWTCWQYNFNINPLEAFIQEGTPTQPMVYWLDVQAKPLQPGTLFGWKTSVNHWNDDAVWGQGQEPYPGPWFELRYPPGHEMHPQSIDLAFVITTLDQEERDWGDAPDSPLAPGYPTLAINNGANHKIVAGAPWLGDATDGPDPEADGQPDPNALGDDNDGNDDEDGVVIPILIQGQPGTVIVQINSGGMGTGGNLDAWIDFNGDRVWQDPGERIFGGWLANGMQNISFPVPASAIVGQTFGRFRISSSGGLLPTGAASDGEVEDHPVYIEPATDVLDWGDAPDPSYPTLAASNGANHVIGGPWLGDATDGPDPEADGQPDPNAMGDDNDGNDDEDGVSFGVMIKGQPSNVTFEVNDGGSGTGGVVEGWVDFDGNGTWDASELVVAGLFPAGVQNVAFTVPASAAVGQTFARFRISLQGTGTPLGGAPDGEVEDHVVFIEPGLPEPYDLEFSIDIGSDTELSDPKFNGNEVFDPGDVYKWWQGPPSPGPRNGFKDDRVIFGGIDPAPTPGAGNPVPVGQGNIQQYPNYWDIDGHDEISFEMQQFVPIEMPLPGPIIIPSSPCVHPLGHLAVSFDDDMRPGWPANNVPVTSFSPLGLIYGTTLNRDEVIGVTLAAGPLPGGYLVVNQYPIADEVTVHTDMQTNPDCSNQEDDDVDSLDIVPRGPQENLCPYWLFTCDHEANKGLAPGDIYQIWWMGGGAPVRVIDDVIHLGLPDSTDIDAFEIVLMPPAPGAPGALAVVFSVDDDDPLTPADESGGLDPKMLYGSFLTGTSFPILSAPLSDDIDAITNWREEIIPPSVQPTIQAIAWRSMRFHPAPANAWLDIPLNPTAMGANATSECRSGGIQQVEVDFTEPIAVGNPAALAAVNTANGVVFPVSGWSLVNANQTLVMNWLPGGLPNKACYKIDLTTAGIVGTVSGGALGGDPCCLVRGLVGDTNNDGKTDLTDMAQVKAKALAGATVPPDQRFDVNMDGIVSLTDMALVKSLAMTSPQAACP